MSFVHLKMGCARSCASDAQQRFAPRHCLVTVTETGPPVFLGRQGGLPKLQQAESQSVHAVHVQEPHSLRPISPAAPAPLQVSPATCAISSLQQQSCAIVCISAAVWHLSPVSFDW
jgi:hypothetical protein